MSNHKVIENWGTATLLYVFIMIIDHKTTLSFMTIIHPSRPLTF